MAHRQHRTWYEQQQKRRLSPFLSRIDRSFGFRLFLASGAALLLLGALNRVETCRALDHGKGCLFQDPGSLLSIGNLEAYSITTATLLYLLESERRQEQTNRDAFETLIAANQAGIVHSLSRIRALETLSDAGCSLEGLDLHGTNLTRLQIPYAQLQRINFSGTVLAAADLHDADLTNANLTGADLTQANLVNATLTGADLTGSNLASANLTGANLSGTTLTGANLTGAIFVRTQLDGSVGSNGVVG
jgi:uncharacterized protein YjbI with pentapeptide repeats